MRVVIDTSTFVAALRSGKGASAAVIRLALAKQVVLLMDYKLISEYRDVAFRPEHLSVFSYSLEQVGDFINTLEALAEPILIRQQPRPLSSDPNDDMVLDLAMNGSADAIVTHNVKHFMTPAARYGITVFRPAELLESLRKKGNVHASTSTKDRH